MRESVDVEDFGKQNCGQFSYGCKRMNEPEINLYCDVMQEIKRRIAALQAFLTGGWRVTYKAIAIESACLQVRKTLELIALGSLVLNRREFERVNGEFAKCWNARLILKDIERLNPDFYPRPIRATGTALVDLESGFLTRGDFEKVYEKCGAIVHARNPFASAVDFQFYERSIPTWISEISRLLNNHTMRLLGDPNLYVVHMRENQDDFVHAYTFAPVRDSGTSPPSARE